MHGSRKRLDPAVRDRAIGCLLGLAVGDALGAPLEFSQRDSVPPVTEMIGGGPFGLRPGQWTDDTSMALCLGDSLIACGRLDRRDLMQRFIRWWRKGENSVTGWCFDIGSTTSAALARFEATGNPLAGDPDEVRTGNGSIMRLAPAVLHWLDARDEAIEAARDQSATTHGASAAVEACGLLAEVLLDAIWTGDKTTALRSRATRCPELADVASGKFKRKGRARISSAGNVTDTLRAALWAVHRGEDFEHALTLAVNLGGDADTIGAVAGQIAGALWGKSGIPQRWLGKLAWRAKIDQRARLLIGTPGSREKA